MIENISFHSIGTIHSPHKSAAGTPIQPTAAIGVLGTVELLPEYLEGIEDLDGFSFIILLYHFDRAKETRLTVKPFLDDKHHGVFSTRAPTRPNHIGLSIVRLNSIEGNILHIKDVDILDGTPLLDIKPYIDAFDVRTSIKQGWIESNIENLPGKKDDGRFFA
jgi:tRNA-Thr(GGU) m(6)t(6)A37 methyltransferase TsaA